MRSPYLDGYIGTSRDERLVVLRKHDVIYPVGMCLNLLPEQRGRWFGNAICIAVAVDEPGGVGEGREVEVEVEVEAEAPGANHSIATAGVASTLASALCLPHTQPVSVTMAFNIQDGIQRVYREAIDAQSVATGVVRKRKNCSSASATSRTTSAVKYND
jgi:hypothetical protein